MTATLDLEALNEAARPVYDVALELGRRAGAEEATSRLCSDHALNLIDLAGHLANHARHVDDDELALRLVALVNMTLGRTPGLANHVALSTAARAMGRAPSSIAARARALDRAELDRLLVELAAELARRGGRGMGGGSSSIPPTWAPR